jgi:hypothetical protein
VASYAYTDLGAGGQPCAHLLTTDHLCCSNDMIWLGTEELTNVLDPIVNPTLSSSEHQISFPAPVRNDISSQPIPLSNHIPAPFVDGPSASAGPMRPTTTADHHTQTSSSLIVADNNTASIPGLLNAHRKVMPDADLEEDLVELQERCTKEGGDPAAIALIPTTFAKGVSREALKRRKPKRGVPPSMTDGFLKFVGRGSVTIRNEGGVHTVPLYWCLLCPSGQRLAYKDVKNIEPHLCSKHFGLSSRGKGNGES